jgi:hypothetical protein
MLLVVLLSLLSGEGAAVAETSTTSTEASVSARGEFLPSFCEKVRVEVLPITGEARVDALDDLFSCTHRARRRP